MNETKKNEDSKKNAKKNKKKKVEKPKNKNFLLDINVLGKEEEERQKLEAERIAREGPIRGDGDGFQDDQ